MFVKLCSFRLLQYKSDCPSNNVSFQLFLPSSTNHFIYISVAECCLRVQIKGDNSFNNILVFIYDLTEGYCEYQRTDTNINTEDYQTA